LLSGIHQKLISRLQQVQNAAARLLTASSRQQHITLSCHPYVVSPFILELILKSFLFLLKFLTKSNLTTKGDRASAVRAPKLWNDLPEDLRLAKSVSAFKSQLKTHFYRLAFM
ncbi:hypothetical protein LDENG_00035850, partial [Lucifuga dentata]